MTDEYSVYSQFDLEKHKKKYVNYLEVMIDPEGCVHYAVPSHQEYAIKTACEKLGVTRSQLNDMTPPEYYLDWMTWLLMQSGYMAVWNDFFICPTPNRKQIATLRKLKMSGVYRGSVK